MSQNRGSPYIAAETSVVRLMLLLIFALTPGIFMMLLFYGMNVLQNIFFTLSAALVAEAFSVFLRKRPITPQIKDCSAIVTGLLLALALPPGVPWWTAALGGIIAITFGKHIFGGLGQNPFNPAMVAYLILLIALPQIMTTWPPMHFFYDPSIGVTSSPSFDAITGATPLDQIKTGWTLSQTLEETMQVNPQLFNDGWAQGWLWINLAYLVGGIFMLYRSVIRWHIPASVIGGIFITSMLIHLSDPSHYAGPLFHLFSGASMLAAFFIATDPVSAATSNKGRLIYGFGIGIIAVAIRNFGLYPDGFAFAIIFMNILAPTIDRYTIPKAYGHTH